MSLKKFRFMDLFVFTLIAIIIDSVIGLNGLLGLKLFISVGIPIVLFLYIRWGKYALLSNIILIIAHFLIYYVNFQVMIAHSLGLLSLSLAIVLVKWNKLSKRVIEFQYVVLYFIFAYLVMLCVDWTFLFLLNQKISMSGLLLDHSLNIVLSIGLLYMISRQKDLMVNMPIYLQNNVEGDSIYAK